jgi:SH3-like domain-containing protein
MALPTRAGSFGAVVWGGVCLAVLAGGAYGLWSSRSDAGNAVAAEAATGATASLGAPMRRGDSGLPLPRFVTLKADRVNVRRGPSSEHKVAWVFTRKGLPVEIVAEFEHWRRIRDSEGAEGWVYHSLLSGRRSVLVAPWSGAQPVPLLDAVAAEARAKALLATGVMADIDSCTGAWCRVSVAGHDGWVDQAKLWGVYPGEQVD